MVGGGTRSMRALVERDDTELVAPPPHLVGALTDVDTPDQLVALLGVDSS